MDYPSIVSYPANAIYPGGEVVVNGYSVTGPDSGTVGAPSTNFTITANPNGTAFEGDEVFTPGDNSSGGTFTPPTISPTAGQTSVTFTYTAATAGTRTITVANNQGWAQPGGKTYQAINSGFSPDEVSGQTLWLNADSITADDEDLLSTWEDSSALGRNATQGSGVAQPVYFANGGNPYVQFDGQDDFMSIPAATNSTSGTIFLIIRATPPGASGYVLDFGDSNLNAIISGFQNNAVENYDSPRISSGAVDTANFHIYCIVRNGGSTTTTTYRDGVQIATSAGIRALSGNIWKLASSTSAGGYYAGDFKGVLVYNRVLTSDELDDINQWASATYGIPLP